jgi:acetyl-CoA C-acetyltransferase
MEARRVAIVGGNRIPFARSNGAYARASNQDMLTAAIDGLVARLGLAGERLGEVAAGAVLKHSRDFNLTRESVLGSRLDPRTPAYDVQQACGTGLEATILVANKIALGQIEAGIAGGVDTTSDAPLAVNEDLRRALLELNRARSLGDRLRAVAKLRPTQLKPDIPRNAEPRTGLSMGNSAAITAREWGVTREQQDELALASHQRLAAAYDRGFFDDLVIPYLGLKRDQNLRPDTSLERLGKLQPVFGRGPDATMTAGNSSPLTDGAASLWVGSSKGMAHLPSTTPRVKLVDWEIASVDFRVEGLLMAPAFAIPRLLARHDLRYEDVHLWEIHEAFAAQLAFHLKALQDKKFLAERAHVPRDFGPFPRERVNPNGGSTALGHPFGATGARIISMAVKALAAMPKGQRAIVSICADGGLGSVLLLESA